MSYHQPQNTSNSSKSKVLDNGVNASASTVSTSSSSNAFADPSNHQHGSSTNKPSTDLISDGENISFTEVEAQSRPSSLVIILTLASSISGFMFGYDTGYISSALVQIGTDLSNKVLTSGEKEFITSATSLGALIGSFMGGFSANILGRKRVLLVSNVIFVIGTIIQLAAKTVWTMISGRFVLGLGVGIASLIAPLMLSELSPSKYRGRLIVTNCGFITGGQLIAYLINWGLTRVDHGWRISVGLCMIPPVIQFVLFCFLPDTPRYYVINGKYDKAREVVRKTHNNPSEAFVNATVEDMIASNSIVPGNGPAQQIWNSVKLIHVNAANFRALIIACGLQGIQQFTGFNSLMYFSATIFETIGFNNPTAVSIIIAATNFVFTGVALLVIDTVGRRRILLLAIPVMTIAMVVCAIAFHYLGIKFTDGSNVVVETTGISGWGIVVIMGMVLFVASYAIGIGNSAWTGVELFSDVNVRSIGAMYSAGTNWAGSMVIASTFLTMLENITPTGTFALFGGLCVISFFFVYFLLPEVSGLELEETTEFLANGFNVKQASALSKQRKKNSKFVKHIDEDF
ncbi:general substrate transporter [Scheffersomyces amazonensis]|uniref:general substrate transporter n=1 Tax=Scheffersomyces amazonensis TaxID=1078765 RepID=UPI00315D6A91